LCSSCKFNYVVVKWNRCCCCCSYND